MLGILPWPLQVPLELQVNQRFTLGGKDLVQQCPLKKGMSSTFVKARPHSASCLGLKRSMKTGRTSFMEKPSIANTFNLRSKYLALSDP